MLREHHIPVSRTARYYTLGERHDGVREIWFACHGYGQLAGRFLRPFERIAAPHRLIVAPEALSRFYVESTGLPHAQVPVGASWMTREDRLCEIDDYIRYLDALHAQLLDGFARRAVRVVVLGFSQGVATACRWVARGNSTADELLLWGGQIPNDVDLGNGSALRRLRLRIVLGDADHYATPDVIAAEEARLAESRVPFERISYPGGHRIDADVLATLADGAGAEVPR